MCRSGSVDGRGRWTTMRRFARWRRRTCRAPRRAAEVERMSLLVTGSIGIDTVETPHGRVENVLGGSAIYFSLAAALFCDVKLVGVVGEDFDRKMLEPLKAKRIDISG